MLLNDLSDSYDNYSLPWTLVGVVDTLVLNL